jgi:DNA-directed RNA polymerase subunit N (RpoN/RPB10)
MEPIKCFTCGKDISVVWDVFMELRNLAVEKGAEDLEAVFEALGFRREEICCRGRLATTVLFTDFQRGHFQPAGIR